MGKFSLGNKKGIEKEVFSMIVLKRGRMGITNNQKEVKEKGARRKVEGERGRLRTEERVKKLRND